MLSLVNWITVYRDFSIPELNINLFVKDASSYLTAQNIYLFMTHCQKSHVI